MVLAASWADGRVEPVVELTDIETAGLTREELDVLARLDAACSAFAVLPGMHHPSDHDEVAYHVRAISENYLIPDETQDTAFMFVPSESIFADIHEHFDDVVQKAMRQRVVIVSPLMLMLSIQVVQSLLRDVRMREEAHKIQKEVRELLDDVGRLKDRVIALQKHFAQANGDITESRMAPAVDHRHGVRSGIGLISPAAVRRYRDVVRRLTHRYRGAKLAVTPQDRYVTTWAARQIYGGIIGGNAGQQRPRPGCRRLNHAIESCIDDRDIVRAAVCHVQPLAVMRQLEMRRIIAGRNMLDHAPRARIDDRHPIFPRSCINTSVAITRNRMRAASAAPGHRAVRSQDEHVPGSGALQSHAITALQERNILPNRQLFDRCAEDRSFAAQ